MANGDYSFQISSLVVSLIRFNRINHDDHANKLEFHGMTRYFFV